MKIVNKGRELDNIREEVIDFITKKYNKVNIIVKEIVFDERYFSVEFEDSLSIDMYYSDFNNITKNVEYYHTCKLENEIKKDLLWEFNNRNTELKENE